MIGLFVDGSFLRKAWRDRCGAAILSYDALRTLIERETGEHIGVAYWFDAQFPDAIPNDRQRAALLRAGFRVKTQYRVVKETVHDCSGRPVTDPITKQPLQTYRQKGVDVGLARAIEHSHSTDNWQHLVLAAGDADFAELVEDLVERRRVRVTMVGADRSISLAFRPFIDAIIDLERYAADLTMLRSA